MSPLHQKSRAKENGNGAGLGVSRLGFGANFAHYSVTYMTLGGASQMALEVKNLPANAGDKRDMGSIPGSGGFPGGGTWQPTSVFFPGEFHGQRSLVGYSPKGHKESDMTEATQH